MDQCLLRILVVAAGETVQHHPRCRVIEEVVDMCLPEVCKRSAADPTAPAPPADMKELRVICSTATNTTQHEITMSGIGADLPPHLLAKRKRQEEEAPSDAPAPASGAKRPSSPDEPDKRRRVLGPAMPPAPLDERPSEPPKTKEEDSSDDDDDFGPSLPTEDAVAKTPNEDEEEDTEAAAPAQQPLKRDDWMMMPPTQDDLAARLDPTKQRPKAFNTGKGARGPNPAGEDSSTWHETPEQKQKRLQDEMMGISKASAPTKSGSTKSSKVKDEATKHKIQEHVSLHFPPAQQTSCSWRVQRMLIPHCRTRPVDLP